MLDLLQKMSKEARDGPGRTKSDEDKDEIKYSKGKASIRMSKVSLCKPKNQRNQKNQKNQKFAFSRQRGILQSYGRRRTPRGHRMWRSST